MKTILSAAFWFSVYLALVPLARMNSLNVRDDRFSEAAFE